MTTSAALPTRLTKRSAIATWPSAEPRPRSMCRTAIVAGTISTTAASCAAFDATSRPWWAAADSSIVCASSEFTTLVASETPSATGPSTREMPPRRRRKRAGSDSESIWASWSVDALDARRGGLPRRRRVVAAGIARAGDLPRPRIAGAGDAISERTAIRCGRGCSGSHRTDLETRPARGRGRGARARDARARRHGRLAPRRAEACGRRDRAGDDGAARVAPARAARGAGGEPRRGAGARPRRRERQRALRDPGHAARHLLGRSQQRPARRPPRASPPRWE